MASNAKKWIVKDDAGHIYGPFEISKVRDLLAKGLLTGEEEAAIYPSGDWAPMSAEPELYNAILEALTTEKQKAAKTKAPHLTQQKPKLQKDSPITKVERQTSTQKSKVELVPTSKTLPALTQVEEENRTRVPPPLITASNDIELEEKDKIEKKFKLHTNVVPIVLAIMALLLIIYGSRLRQASQHFVSLNLLAPHLKANGSPEKAENAYKEGVGHFYKDTAVEYIKAEEDFVRAVEESPQYNDALLMLLLTDLELWPVTKQDSSDQAVMQNLLQMLSKSDVQGTKREIASPVVEMALGHEDLARTQIDSALVRQAGEGFLYALKGQTFYDANDFAQALSYYEKASTLLPNWVKPYYYMGLSNSKLDQAAPAQQSLIQALRMNPSHPGARLELGVIESRFFNHDEKAKEFLTVALEGENRLPPLVEARGRITLARILARAGDVRGAKREAQLASRLSPSDPDLAEVLEHLGEKGAEENMGPGSGTDREHLALGDQYMRTSNFLGAQAQYKAAFGANPGNARAAMKVAEALWKLHQTTEAMEYLQKSIGADPKFIESYVRLADYKSQRYDFEGAQRTLEMAIKKSPKNYEIFRGYGELEFRRGNVVAAEVDVSRALQLYEIDLESNVLMSKVQLEKKDLIKALQFGKRAIEIDRGDGKAQVNYAQVLFSYQGVKEAAEYLRGLIDLFPGQIDLRVGLAEILMQDEQYTVVEQILKQVLNSDPTNKEASMLLGDAKYGEGDINSALSAYLAAARLDPSDPTALYRSGDVYLKANRLAEAIKQYQLVLRVNEFFPRVHYNLARAYFGQGLTEEAIKELEEEKRLNPKLADPYEFSGDILLSTRKFMAAVKEYQKASEFRPLGAGIYVKLAKAYRGQGSYDEAMAMLRIAAAKESGFAEIYKEYGFIYEAKGMDKEAVGNYEKYLNLEPNAPDRDTITERIAVLK